MDRIHPTTALALAAVALVIGLVAGAAGSSDDIPCQAGEVYVVDTDTCASAFDHEAHAGHEPETPPASETPVRDPEYPRSNSTVVDLGCPDPLPKAVKMGDVRDVSMMCKAQLDIACNPEDYPGYSAIPGYPSLECPWPPTDPDAESPANSIPPFPNHWYHGDH